MLESAAHTIIKSIPPTPERLPLFIVGDVHGCAAELERLIRAAKKHVEAFQVVLVGDLFTKGPDPVGVFELIHEHQALCIKGNHDWALWSVIAHATKKSPNTLAAHTKQTLNLIRYHKRSIFDFLCTLPHGLVTTVVPDTPNPHGEESYPLVIVHAGIDPTVGVYNTTERMLLTARFVKWGGTPGHKKLVLVSAYNRASGREKEPSADAEEDTTRFRWHELHFGPELIVFGHDAKQGLFRKTLPSGRPICVGIDTGCTYGNFLTGYFPESDLAIQVPSKRRYFDTQKNIILTRSYAPKASS